MPCAADRGGHLPDPGIRIAGIGIDLCEQLDLFLKAEFAQRVHIRIEVAVGVGRRFGHGTTLAGANGADRLACPCNRGFAEFG